MAVLLTSIASKGPTSPLIMAWALVRSSDPHTSSRAPAGLHRFATSTHPIPARYSQRIALLCFRSAHPLSTTRHRSDGPGRVGLVQRRLEVGAQPFSLRASHVDPDPLTSSQIHAVKSGMPRAASRPRSVSACSVLVVISAVLARSLLNVMCHSPRGSEAASPPHPNLTSPGGPVAEVVTSDSRGRPPQPLSDLPATPQASPSASWGEAVHVVPPVAVADSSSDHLNPEIAGGPWGVHTKMQWVRYL